MKDQVAACSGPHSSVSSHLTCMAHMASWQIPFPPGSRQRETAWEPPARDGVAWRGTKWHGMGGVAWQDVPHQEKARMPFHHLSLIEVSESKTACLSGTDSCSLLLPARLTASLTPCPPNCLLARLPACPSSRLPACLPASQLPVSDCSQRACLCAMHIVHVAKFKKECTIALWYFTPRL